MTAKKASKSKKSKGAPTGAPTTAPVSVGPFRLRYEWLFAVLFMIVAICVLYPELVFHDQIFFSGDNQAAASFSTVGDEALARGTYPVWNPYLFAGMPSFASLSYTPYVYPVNYMVGWLHRFLFFPNSTWLLFHTLMIGLGVFWILRDRRVHYLAAITAGIVMMWMPNLVAVGAHGHGSQASACAYLPFALLFWDRLWRGMGTVRYGAALTLVLGLSMLRGHLQISYYTYALVALYAVFFGIARLADGARGRAPGTTVLPRRWAARWLTGGEPYTVGAAVAEVAWAALVLAVVVAGSLLMSAVLHVPVHDYARYSIRGATASGGLSYDYATSWSLHPSEVITFVLPYAFGFGKDLYYGHMPFTDYPNYLGLVVFVFAVVAVVRARSRFVWFLVFTALVATFTSFGKYFPVVYDPLFKLAPFFNKFRVPVMVLIVQQLAVIVLFGIGLDAALRVDRARGRKWAMRGLVGAAVVLLIAVFSHSYWTGGFAARIAPDMRMARTAQQQMALAQQAGANLAGNLIATGVVLALLAVLMFVLYTRGSRRAVIIVGAVCALAVTDLWSIDRTVLHPERFRGYEGYRLIHNRSVLDAYRAPGDLVDFLRKDKRFYRIFPMDGPRRPFGGLFQSNRFMNFSISSIGGYHAAKLAAYQEFLQKALAPSLGRGDFRPIDMLNVRYLVSGAQLPDVAGLKRAWSGRNAAGAQRFVYENLQALPRLWFVDQYRVAPDEQALSLLGSGKVAVADEAVVDHEPDPRPVSRQGAGATITDYGFNRIAIRAHLQQPALLVLSEIYYPAWKVTVDGRPAPMLRADYLLRAVALESGDHEVVFHYDTSLLKASAEVSASTLVVVLGLLIVSAATAARSRKRGSTGRHTDVQRT